MFESSNYYKLEIESTEFVIHLRIEKFVRSNRARYSSTGRNSRLSATIDRFVARGMRLARAEILQGARSARISLNKRYALCDKFLWETSGPELGVTVLINRTGFGRVFIG